MINLAHSPLILLAAGASSRMGFPKGLLPVKEQTLMHWQWERFARAGGKQVVVVLGAKSEVYFDALEILVTASKSMCSVQTAYGLIQLSVVLNPSWEQGPFSSLRASLELIFSLGSPDGVFVSPVDCPLPSPEVFGKLAQAIGQDQLICKPMCQGRGGHPVLLSGHFAHSLLSVDLSSPEARLDRQIGRLPKANVARVDVEEPGVLLNFNDRVSFETWAKEQ